MINYNSINKSKFYNFPINIQKLFLIIIFLISCNKTNKTQKPSSFFTKPIIEQPPIKDSVKYFEADFVNGSFPLFAGKFKFNDTLFLNNILVTDSTFKKDYIYEARVGLSDSLMCDGFEIISDYYTSVYQFEYTLKNKYANYYYPVYIINQTPSIKAFVGKDGYVYGLQEALDKNGRWRPIEGLGLDFCGNGVWGLKVHSHEYIAILFPKYTGDYKTKIRVRIKIGENIYISKPFDGTINEKQLYLKKGSYLSSQLFENKLNTIQNLFYGAIPFGAED